MTCTQGSKLASARGYQIPFRATMCQFVSFTQEFLGFSQFWLSYGRTRQSLRIYTKKEFFIKFKKKLFLFKSVRIASYVRKKVKTVKVRKTCV